MKHSLGKKLDLLLYTGCLLIKCLADSNRVDRNIRRVAAYMGIPSDKFHMHITYTSLIINISDGEKSVTRVQKISEHHIDMQALDAISRLTWKASRNSDFPLEEYEKEITEIAKLKHVYPAWFTVIAAGVACACFSKIFGADVAAMCVTFLAASLAFTARRFLASRKLNMYFIVVVAAFIASAIATGCSGFSSTPDYAIIASALFLVPGVPLINSVDDLIDGFTMVGITRATIATLIISGITFGMLSAATMFSFGNFQPQPHPQSSLWTGVAAAFAATGFAVIFNVPKRFLIICALGGIAAVGVRNFLMIAFDTNIEMASFVSAVLVGFTAIFSRWKFQVPMCVVTVPAIIPMIPGVVMYDAVVGMIYMNSSKLMQTEMLVASAQAAVTSCITIFLIAVGIAFPKIAYQRYLNAKETIK